MGWLVWTDTLLCHCHPLLLIFPQEQLQASHLKLCGIEVELFGLSYSWMLVLHCLEVEWYRELAVSPWFLVLCEHGPNLWSARVVLVLCGVCGTHAWGGKEHCCQVLRVPSGFQFQVTGLQGMRTRATGDGLVSFQLDLSLFQIRWHHTRNHSCIQL